MGDPAVLAEPLDTLEHDRRRRYRTLKNRSRTLRPLVDPARGRHAWPVLIDELALTPR